MLKSTIIKEKITENHQRSSELENLINNRATPSSIHEMNEEAWQSYKKEVGKWSEELNFRRILGKILKDNYRMAIFTEVMPVLHEVLLKYNGKSIGPKTQDKISHELEEKTGFKCSLYNDTYDSKIVIYSYECGLYYKDMEIWKYGMFDGNKLVVFPIEEYKLSYCSEYVDDPEARANEIKAGMENLVHLYDNFREACDKFNDLLPSGIENASAYNFKPYISYQ